MYRPHEFNCFECFYLGDSHNRTVCPVVHVDRTHIHHHHHFNFILGSVCHLAAVPREFARSTINRLCVCVSVSVDGAQRDCISTINFPSINSTKCYYDWFIHTHQSTWTGCVRVFFIWLDREIAQQLHGTDQQSSYTVNIIINLISFFVANQF